MWSLGCAASWVGLVVMEPRVEGVYLNRAVDQPDGPAAQALAVDGKTWVVTGVTLMTLGGGLAAVTLTSRHPGGQWRQRWRSFSNSR